MSEEPTEVEVLNKDGTPAVPKKISPIFMAPIQVLAFVFAVLTALMILLVGAAGILLQQDEPPE